MSTTRRGFLGVLATALPLGLLARRAKAEPTYPDWQTSRLKELRALGMPHLVGVRLEPKGPMPTFIHKGDVVMIAGQRRVVTDVR